MRRTWDSRCICISSTRPLLLSPLSYPSSRSLLPLWMLCSRSSWSWWWCYRDKMTENNWRENKIEIRTHIRPNVPGPVMWLQHECEFNNSKFTNFTHSLLLPPCTPSEPPPPSIRSAPCCIQDQTQNSRDKVSKRVTQGSDISTI